MITFELWSENEKKKKKKERIMDLKKLSLFF